MAIQKMLNNILAFGKDLPHEREIGIALIILGIGLILYFQMEESTPARVVTRSSSRVSTTSAEPPAAKTTPSKSHKNAKTSPAPAAEKETPTPARSRARSKSAAKPRTASPSPARTRRSATPRKR